MPRMIKGPRRRTPTDRYYRIETVCEILDLHPRTLKLYERRGLIQVRWIETYHGQRQALFPPEEVRRLRRIRLLTLHMGVNLAGVEIILRLLDRLEK
jgi:MerR family transcriptional regulator, heat shock protein HspR